MKSAKVVVHEMQGHRVPMVFGFLAVSVGQSGKASVAHANGQILAFNIAGGNQTFVGKADLGDFFRADALWRAVFAGWLVLKDFHQHGVVNIIAKGPWNGVCI